MRQKLRNASLLMSLLAFPVSMNFLSPYVIVHGAMNGIVSGSAPVAIRSDGWLPSWSSDARRATLSAYPDSG
jgi:hypothetical protein